MGLRDNRISHARHATGFAIVLASIGKAMGMPVPRLGDCNEMALTNSKCVPILFSLFFAPLGADDRHFSRRKLVEKGLFKKTRFRVKCVNKSCVSIGAAVRKHCPLFHIVSCRLEADFRQQLLAFLPKPRGKCVV